MSKGRVAFLTLGCKVNSYETEKMQNRFIEAGYTVTSFGEVSDIYVVNTCTVTNMADRKSRKMLHRARKLNPQALVVAAGCYVDSAKARDEVDEAVDLFLANADKADIVGKVEQTMQALHKSLEPAGGSLGFSEQADRARHTRTYLKVQDGCNQYCTYCIIPHVRGPLTSRPVSEVRQEVEELAAQGYQEVVVTGIHLSSYGVDFPEQGIDKICSDSFLELEGRPLLDLLESISEIPGIHRIRLGSLEPRIITDAFVRELSGLDKVCPHFHLSLQSGCDATLRRMNRHYSAQDYLDKLEILRRYYQAPAVTTDIIVGFPQESGEDFEICDAFARQAAFAQIHVFKYSRRKGTIADGMEGQVDEMEKTRRSDILLETAGKLEEQYQEQFLGKDEEILVEEISQIQDNVYYLGHTMRYVKVAVSCGDKADEPLCNTLIRVKITGRVNADVLLGEIVD